MSREAIVFITLQIFFATRAVLKIGEYSRLFPSFSWRIFGHVTCLDQSRASENYLMDYKINYNPPINSHAILSVFYVTWCKITERVFSSY